MTGVISSISFELVFKCLFNHQMTKSQIKTLSLLGFFEIHFYSYFFVSSIIAKAISSILSFNLSLDVHRFEIVTLENHCKLPSRVLFFFD